MQERPDAHGLPTRAEHGRGPALHGATCPGRPGRGPCRRARRPGCFRREKIARETTGAAPRGHGRCRWQVAQQIPQVAIGTGDLGTTDAFTELRQESAYLHEGNLVDFSVGLSGAELLVAAAIAPESARRSVIL